MESAADFGTGLRAHLGLERAELELLPQPQAVPAVPAAPPDEPAAAAAPDSAVLDALATLEAELVERERVLALREASLASRAGSLLAAAQALYDEVLGGGAGRSDDDELARLRRRKSPAA